MNKLWWRYRTDYTLMTTKKKSHCIQNSTQLERCVLCERDKWNVRIVVRWTFETTGKWVNGCNGLCFILSNTFSYQHRFWWADFVKILEFRNLSNLNKPAKNVYHSLDIFVTWVWFQLWKLILTIKHVLAHLYLLYWFLINKAKFINLFMGRMHSIDSVQVLWIKKNSYKK